MAAFIRAAGGTPHGGSEIKPAIQFKAVDQKVDFDRFRLQKQILVDQKGKSVKYIFFVFFSRLIQSQSQSRPRSATLIQKYTDRLGGFPFEIFTDLRCCRSCYFKHSCLLR